MNKNENLENKIVNSQNILDTWFTSETQEFLKNHRDGFCGKTLWDYLISEFESVSEETFRLVIWTINQFPKNNDLYYKLANLYNLMTFNVKNEIKDLYNNIFIDIMASEFFKENLSALYRLYIIGDTDLKEE